MQPVILALSQHTEIQKLAWRVVGQHIIYLPAVRFQRGLAAGVFLVRGHLLRPPVDVDFPLFLVRAFRSAEAEVLLPLQFQYAAPQTWYTLPPSGCTSRRTALRWGTVPSRS